MTLPARGRSEHESVEDGREPLRESHRLERLRLRHLRLLERIRHCGSLGGAARNLGISQPAATLLLRELETVFGTRLVVRESRGARLTQAGELALERLALALSAVQRAIEAARTDAGAPPVRLGCVQVAGVSLLPAALARLERAGTLGQIRLHEGRAHELLSALYAGELDCVVGWVDESVAQSLPAAELTIEPLWQGRMLVVASSSHPLAKSKTVPVADLVRSRWIVPPPGSRTHAAYVRLFLHAGSAAPPVAVQCTTLDTMLRIVSATRLLAVAPDVAVRHYARLRMVRPLAGPGLDLGRSPVSVVTRKDCERLAAVRLVRQALVETALSA